MGVVSRRWVWVESMGVASGCGCKDVYIEFLILLNLTPLVSALFLQQHPNFCSFKKMFFVLVLVLICNLCNNFFAQYKHTYG